MSHDYFAILRLTPGRYNERQVMRQFHRIRDELLAQLDEPATRGQAARRLEELDVAYEALRDPARQSRYVGADLPPDRAGELRRLIADALEDGLMRYSRRQEIIAAGRRLGFNDFQTQLLIAQVQFGDDDALVAGEGRQRQPREARRTWTFVAAAGLLATAMFLSLIWWV